MPSAYAQSNRSPAIIDHSGRNLCRLQDDVHTIMLTERGGTTVCCRPTRDRGFTLIELMIVVVVIGILAAIAYPSYQNYVLRSHRADAQAEMMNLAQAMERCYTINNTYSPTGGCVTLPPTGRYEFTIVPAANSYEISAEPRGSQTNDTSCGTLTLNHRGIRTPTANRCWN